MRPNLAVLAASVILALTLIAIPAMATLLPLSLPPADISGSNNSRSGLTEEYAREEQINWTSVEEYGRLLDQGREMIKKEPNWVPTTNINESSDYVTADGHYIAQFEVETQGNGAKWYPPYGTYMQPDMVVITNLHTGEQSNMSWMQFQDAKEYSRG